MVNRITISALWFVSFFCVHELAWSILGSPRLLGIVGGGMAAAFFYFDPIGLFVTASSPVPDAEVDRRLTQTHSTGLAP